MRLNITWVFDTNKKLLEVFSVEEKILVAEFRK